MLGAESKAKLEDIYLPYKPKRRTKATIAREAGLGPLAAALLADPTQDPRARAEKFVDAEKGIKTPEEALEGARAILVEQFSEKAELIGVLRENFWTRGRIVSKVRDGKAQEGAKFADYFDFFEPLPKLPSHRILALFRGEKEEILDLALEPESAAEAEANGEAAYERAIATSFGVAACGRPGDKWLMDCVALGLAHAHQDFAVGRSARPAVAERRGSGGQGFRRQSARSAAGRARRTARHHGPRSGLSHRRQSGGGGRHRQGGRHRSDLSA